MNADLIALQRLMRAHRAEWRRARDASRFFRSDARRVAMDRAEHDARAAWLDAEKTYESALAARGGAA